MYHAERKRKFFVRVVQLHHVQRKLCEQYRSDLQYLFGMRYDLRFVQRSVPPLRQHHDPKYVRERGAGGMHPSAPVMRVHIYEGMPQDRLGKFRPFLQGRLYKGERMPRSPTCMF